MTEHKETILSIEKGAAWIRLNRPESRNALSAKLINELYQHITQANEDNEVRAIVITGEGSAFCAGADLKSPPGHLVDGKKNVPYPEVLKAILGSSKPVIAAVNGAAYAGGLGLVAASDIIITKEDAQFSFSEVRIGVIPAVISVVCVPKLGSHNAMKLFITGERFSGKDAVRFGLAHHAVPEERLRDEVDSQLEMINLGGPMAIIECKKLVREIEKTSLEEGFKLASPWSQRMFTSEEGTEGMAAFREKRSPAWTKKG
ncbi:MAG: enoyl-CoA hydratase [Gammaproteobacteria bacterium]|nr:enoyl-CoA hydratase [Gammaproteobacteria bacterium]